eukprot:SM000032S12155  [mRNA]  locus=s32:891384:893028:+ [translate_table: standard]
MASIITQTVRDLTQAVVPTSGHIRIRRSNMASNMADLPKIQGPQLTEDPVVAEVFRQFTEQFPENTMELLNTLELLKFQREPDEIITACYFRYVKLIEKSETTISPQDLAAQLKKRHYDIKDIYQVTLEREAEEFLHQI